MNERVDISEINQNSSTKISSLNNEGFKDADQDFFFVIQSDFPQLPEGTFSLHFS
jgi:hypothetical protein